MHIFIFVEKERMHIFQRAELQGCWIQKWLILEEIEIIWSLAEWVRFAIIIGEKSISDGGSNRNRKWKGQVVTAPVELMKSSEKK